MQIEVADSNGWGTWQACEERMPKRLLCGNVQCAQTWVLVGHRKVGKIM